MPDQADVFAPLRAVLPDDFPEPMRELVELMFLQLLEDAAVLGEAPAAALAAVAVRQIDRMCREVGGSSVYFHKGVSWRLTPRNRQMIDEFRGDYKVLARQYGLSEQQVRNIVDSGLREHFLVRQGDMFPPPADKY